MSLILTILKALSLSNLLSLAFYKALYYIYIIEVNKWIIIIGRDNKQLQLIKSSNILLILINSSNILLTLIEFSDQFNSR